MSRIVVTVKLVNNATSVPPLSINLYQTAKIYRTTVAAGVLTLKGDGGTGGYTYAQTGLAGTGLSLNTATGEITGTPNTIGKILFSATVTDSGTNTATAQFSIDVLSRLTIVSGTPTNAEHNYVYAGGTGYQFAVAGNTGSVTYAKTAGTLPATSGAPLTVSSGGLLSSVDTIAAAGGGSYFFVVTATDAGTGDTLDISCRIDVFSEFKTNVTPAKVVLTVGIPRLLTMSTLGAHGGAPIYAISSISKPADLTLAFNPLDGSATLTANAAFAKTAVSSILTDSLGIEPSGGGGYNVFITAIDPNQEIIVYDETGSPLDMNPLSVKLHSSDASVNVATSVDSSGNMVADLTVTGGGSGYAFHAIPTGATTLTTKSKNRLDANTCAVTMPADASCADGDDLQIYADVARSGCTVIPNSAQQVDVGSGSSGSSQTLPATKFSIWLAYTKATKNWFMTSITTE